MPRKFSSLHARTICHATEDIARVEQALRTVVGDADVRSSRAEGHHGNPIVTLESVLRDEGDIVSVFARMSQSALSEVLGNLEDRIDQSCNLFLRFDKQEAYGGRLVLVAHDDVVAVRIKVRAFPARRDIATETVRGFVLGDAALKEPGRPSDGDA